MKNYERYERVFEESSKLPTNENDSINLNTVNTKLNYNALTKMTREPAVENPHFSLPETFHNALSFRNYENHGFSSSITNLLDTFIVQNDHNNSHSYQRIPRGGHFDNLLSPTSDGSLQELHTELEPDYSHLRKNTPKDFPLIVRQAMECKDAESNRKFSFKDKLARQNAILQMPMQQNEENDKDQSLPPPPSMALEPDTPSIENAPTSIDFSSAVNNNKFLSDEKNTTNVSDTDDENNTVSVVDVNLNRHCPTQYTRKRRSLPHSDSSGISSDEDDEDERNAEEFLNNINALKLDDDVEIEMSHGKNKSPMKLSLDSGSSAAEYTMNYDDDNDDDVEGDAFREYNSHQYWYISPDIPVDMDIFLEPEEKSRFFCFFCLFFCFLSRLSFISFFNFYLTFLFF